jgi:lipopolysaccharide transport system permease protein
VPVPVASSNTDDGRVARNEVCFGSNSARWPDLAEIWSYRDLVILLALRDIKLRYRQTLVGGAWAILQPLLLSLAFSVPLSRVTGISPSGTSYFLFVFAGLIPWLYFAASVTRCSESVVAYGDIVRKVYFPRILIPLAATLPAIVDSAITFVLAILLIAWQGSLNPAGLPLIVPLALWSTAIALGVGLWLAALNVLFRDVRNVTPFLLQFLMFASPVFYATDLIPSTLIGLYVCNPLVGLIESVRAALLGTPLTPGVLAPSMAITILLFVGGIWMFLRTERRFADVI